MILRTFAVALGAVLFSGCAASPAPRPAAPPTVSAPKYQGPIIDVHAHLRIGDDDAGREEQPKGTVELRKLEEAAGAKHAALIVIAPKGKLEVMRSRNDAAIEAAKASGGFFFPIASVHPADGDAALAELERVAKLGVKVIKLHPNSQNFDVADPAVGVVVRKAADLGLVLLFDAYSPFDANETGKFLRLAIENPKARLILAHLGAVRFHEMAVFGLVKQFSWYPHNVWFDLSAVASFYATSPYRDELVWVIRSIGTDRILFGSDWPVDPPARAAKAVHDLGLSAAEERQIYFGNANDLFKLE